MIAAYYRPLCSKSLSDTKEVQLGPGTPQVFMVIVSEFVQAVLCWRGAYTAEQPMAAEGTGGGLLKSVGGWKLGLLTLLSYATLIWTWVATNPLLPHEGWLRVHADDMKVYCNAWWCLQLIGKDGELGAESGWQVAKTLDFFPSTCSGLGGWGNLEQSIQLIQIWGTVTFLTVAWSTANHAVNLVCDWLKVFRPRMFVFHFANSFLALFVVQLMAQTYHRDYCGEAIKDKKYGDHNLELGFVSFGMLIVVSFVEAILGLLCYSGAYQEASAQPPLPVHLPSLVSGTGGNHAVPRKETAGETVV